MTKFPLGEPMQSVLITAYQDPDNLFDLLNYFGPHFAVYLHLDRRVVAGWRKQGILSQLTRHPAVRYLSTRYSVHWGGINHLLAILELSAKAAEQPDCGYVHLITGQDFPLISKEELLDFPNKALGKSFLDYSKLPSPYWPRENGGFDRLRYFHLYDIMDIGRYSDLDRKVLNIQRRLRISRPLPRKIQLYGGSTYWSLSADCVRYIAKPGIPQKRLLKRLQYCFCAEEIYIQTVLVNSPHSPTLACTNLRYIDWTGNHDRERPAVLDQRDASAALESKALFARKVDSRVSEVFKKDVRRRWTDA